MKKSLLAVTAGLAILLAGAAAAPASITSPAMNGAVTHTGRIRWLEPLITVTCDVSLSGAVLTRSFVGISSGTTSPCSAPVTTFVMTPSFNWVQSLAGLTGTFVIHDVRITTRLPSLAMNCIYDGTLSGTYTRTVNSVWTITSDTLTRDPSSSALCTSNPALTGTLTTNLTIV